MTLKEAALQYYNYGLSTIPIGDNKIPQGRWKEAQFSLIEPNENFDKAKGIGIVCGTVSGNMFCIDFDTKNDLSKPDSWDKFKAALNGEQRGLVKRCVVESTPSNGRHLIYRVDGVIGGNEKFAARFTIESERLVNPKSKILCTIESRGIGGYFQVAPTEKYEILNGSFDNLPVLTQEQHDGLINICKSLDETGMWSVKPEEKKLAQQPKRLGVSVFDDYNFRGDIPQLLEDSDWRYVETQGNNMRFKRPGTTDSRTSADWHTDKRLLYVFTSSTEFEPNKGYNAVQVFTMLNCGSLNKDTYREAAKQLRELGYGEQDVQEDEIEKQIELEKTNHYLAEDDEIDKFLQDVRDDKILMGVGIGMPDLDHYFVYKPNNFYMIGGLSNVGKTDWVIWWFVQLSRKHDFNWLICSTENEVGELIKMAAEYYAGQQLKSMSQERFEEAKTWAKEHFTIFSNKRTYTYHEVLNAAKEEMTKKAYAGLLCDPYSGLELDVQELKLYGEYRYHYRAATQFRLFTKQTGCSIFLIAHPNTEANKRLKDGFAQAPFAADIEFGSMWQNRCDNSVTIHRIINHPLEWNVTEIHVRKIKSKFTGGDITSEPVKLKRNKDCYFEDAYGRTTSLLPLSNYYEKDDSITPF